MSPPKTAWITGASSGIGAALAAELAAHGWQVAASGRDRARLDAVCARASESIHAFTLDVTDVHANRQVASDIAAKLGPIDLAVFNAGISKPMPTADFDAETVNETMRVNYEGAVNGIAAVLPAMRERCHGHIALTASVAGYRGLPGGGAAYCASKAAMIALAEGLKMDLARDGIAVSVVAPGFVRTPLTGKNQFPMPLIMEPEAAARRIRRGLEAGHFEIAFPRRLAYLLKSMQRLPYAAYFPLIKRIAGNSI